jgi:hypothetical protein
MGWAARIGWGLVGLGVAGCGEGVGGGTVSPGPAAVTLADRCTVDGVRVEVEQGVEGGFAEGACAYSGRFVSVWRGIYEERWGTAPVESWTVRIRAPDRLDGQGRAGLTWYAQRLVEVSQVHFELLPHELHHVRLGAASNDHHGWCADFVPWELERHIQDERAQLGCAL